MFERYLKRLRSTPQRLVAAFGHAAGIQHPTAYLRNKIDVPFSQRSIETVRGVGYRLVPDA